MRRGKVISRYFLGITIVFVVYLVILSIIGKSENITPFFYYGFWLVLGFLLGFRLCSYLYENDDNKGGTSKIDDKYKLN